MAPLGHDALDIKIENERSKNVNVNSKCNLQTTKWRFKSK